MAGYIGKTTRHAPDWKIVEPCPGSAYVKTWSSWSRKYGKCDTRTHYRSNEIWSRKRFRAWAKKAEKEHGNIFFRVPTEDDYAKLLEE